MADDEQRSVGDGDTVHSYAVRSFVSFFDDVSTKTDRSRGKAHCSSVWVQRCMMIAGRLHAVGRQVPFLEIESFAPGPYWLAGIVWDQLGKELSNMKRSGA